MICLYRASPLHPLHAVGIPGTASFFLFFRKSNSKIWLQPATQLVGLTNVFFINVGLTSWARTDRIKAAHVIRPSQAQLSLSCWWLNPWTNKARPVIAGWPVWPLGQPDPVMPNPLLEVTRCAYFLTLFLEKYVSVGCIALLISLRCEKVRSSIRGRRKTGGGGLRKQNKAKPCLEKLFLL